MQIEVKAISILIVLTAVTTAGLIRENVTGYLGRVSEFMSKLNNHGLLSLLSVCFSFSKPHTLMSHSTTEPSAVCEDECSEDSFICVWFSPVQLVNRISQMIVCAVEILPSLTHIFTSIWKPRTIFSDTNQRPTALKHSVNHSIPQIYFPVVCPKQEIKWEAFLLLLRKKTVIIKWSEH